MLDPRTGETVGRVPIATPQEGERALRRARVAADGWAHTPASERGAALHAAASAVRDAADELAALTERETGKPFDDARGGPLPVGTVKVDNVFGGAPGGAAQPRRGSGSGLGYGPELLDEMTTTKVVHVSVPPPR